MSFTMSFLYCSVKKSSTRANIWLWFCPYGKSWSGVANFDIKHAYISGTELVIPFLESYPRSPMCFVSTTTGTPRSSHINPEKGYVKVYTFYVNGTAGPWDNVGLQIGCFGASFKNIDNFVKIFQGTIDNFTNN